MMCSKIKFNGIPWDYVERMQILEKENQRLMLSQGQMVQETNRKCEVKNLCNLSNLQKWSLKVLFSII